MSSSTIEIEITYLAARIPEGLAGCTCKELEDIYFPATAEHAKVRIRRSDKTYEFTKKTPLDQNDAGQQKKENIALTSDEFAALAKGDGRRLVKTRYYLPYNGLVGEVAPELARFHYRPLHF